MNVALIGLGGYGENYLRGLLDENDGASRLIAGADPEPHRCRRFQQILDLKLPVYREVEELYSNHRPDVVLIASPAHHHQSHACAALAHGAHVLCEKPAATTLADALAMRHAQRQADRILAIGFQWSFSRAIGALKEDILAGRMGRPRRLKSLVLWPRSDSYYRRNSWAGRVLGAAGEPIFDNPIGNGCAHYLHNMLFLLGETSSRSIWPESVELEIYRLNEIASFDTAALRVRTPLGVELLLIASHGTDTLREPAFCLEFDDATVTYDLGGEGRVVARWAGGMMRDYGPLPSGTDLHKLWMTLQCVRNNSEIACGISAALPHVAVASAVQSGAIHALQRASAQAMGGDLIQAYERWALPSEMGLSWTAPKQLVAISPAQAMTPTISDLVRKEHLV